MLQETTAIISRLDKIETLLSDYRNKPFNLDQAADYLNVSKSYLYKLTSQNKIPYYKPSGKLIFFDKKELDQWILQNRIKPQSEIESVATNHVVLGRTLEKA